MADIGKKFMKMTRYQIMGDAPYRTGEAQPPLEAPVDTEERIPLPDPAALRLGNVLLWDTINERRSLRRYSDTPVTLAELAYLLWCCQGVQKQAEKHTFRTVPSAGARHAFETYVLINRVEELGSGLYRYMALSGTLAPVNLNDGIAESLMNACLGQEMVASAAVTVFWAAEVERMYYRYGERGYRYLHLDAGHACQNLYLASESIKCGACGIAAFDDDKLNAVLGLDGVKEFAVYACAVGKK
jgi:SagB-type dehydrogenase family enzyme